MKDKDGGIMLQIILQNYSNQSTMVFMDMDNSVVIAEGGVHKRDKW